MGVKIPNLPSLAIPDGDDELPIDDNNLSTTKRMSLTKLKTWLQSIIGWISASMLASDSVETDKILDANVTMSKINNPYKFRVGLTGNQTGIADATRTQIVWNYEDFDTNSNFSTATGEYTIPVTGLYQFNVRIRAAGSNITTSSLEIVKNDTVIEKNFINTAATNDISNCCSVCFNCIAGQKVYVNTYVDVSTGTGTVIADSSSFSGYLVSI